MRTPLVVLFWSLAALGCGEPASAPTDASRWSADELAILRSLWLGSLPPPPDRPSNRVAEDPRAAEFGHALFFDPGLSRTGQISCATCHDPALHFTDGLPRSKGIATGSRNAPTIVGSAFAPWQFWDGRRDSLWSQALAPLEAAGEMGTTRLAVANYVTAHPTYGPRYAELFGEPPELPPGSAGPFGDPEEKAAWNALPTESRAQIDTVFANVGKAIEAYERLLQPGESRFDREVDAALNGRTAADPLDANEVAGLRLYIDGERTLCLRCHNGPLFTNQGFHDIGTSRLAGIDFGRFIGVQSLLLDPFNCLGAYSDAEPESCAQLRFLDRSEIGETAGQFKTPTLRDVARTAPYGHDGHFATLEAVMEHYREPPAQPGHELTPLALDDRELAQLVAFLRTLDGGVAAEPRWLAAPAP